MTSCAELAREAVGLASLPENDPSRLAAYRHASDCPHCAGALAEGERLLALIDAIPPPPSPSPEVLDRVRRALAAELATERRPGWLALAPAAGVLAAFFVAGGKYLAGGAEAAPLAVAALCLTAAALAVVGRLALPALAALLLLSGGSVLARGHGDAFAAMVGLHCTGLELLTAAMPVVALAALLWRARARGRTLDVRGLSVAAVGAAGALAGQAALMMHCNSRSMVHELVFHSGGVLVAALLSLAMARFVTEPVRSRSRLP